jgi:hypothetical protein
MIKDIREIKYRVWNDRYKEFTYWGFIDGTFKGPPTGSGLSIEECKKLSQQFTGLKDKQGREIYESDIVLWSYRREWWNDGPGSKKVIVAWDSYNTGFSPFCECDVEGQYPGGEFEVIGNIYENPELYLALDSDSKQ